MDGVSPFAGRVLGTEDATPLEFWVGGRARARYLQLDDVVVASSGCCPTGEPVRIVRRRHPGAGPPRGRPVRLRRLPHRRRHAARRGQRGRRDHHHPGRARGVRAAAARRAGAPGRPGPSATRPCSSTGWSAGCPPGCRRDGEPLYLNLDFLDGTRGAHVNISGISGVATKTSYATFLLYSLFHSGVLGAEAANTKALIFNVKGEDLLFLDHPNTRLDADQAAPRTRTLGLPAGAVRRASPSSPRPARGDPNATPDVASRARPGVHLVLLDARASSARDELLPFVFADAEDERQQYTMVVHNVDRPPAPRRRARGRRRRCSIDGDVGPHVPRPGRPDRRAGSDDDDGPTELGRPGHRRWAPSTRSSAGCIGASRHLAPPDPGRPARPAAHRGRHCERAQVTVVDLHNLPDRAQRFVVGVVLRQAFERKEQAGHGPAAAVRRARRAQQVRAPRGLQPDQGDPARRRRAGPLARHHPDRRAADRERGGAAHRRQLGDPGRRPARPGRGGAARVRLPARRPSGSGPRSPSRARCSSPSPSCPVPLVVRVPVPGLGDPARARPGRRPRRHGADAGGRRPVDDSLRPG